MTLTEKNEVIARFMGGKWETVWSCGVETKAFSFPGWHITEWPRSIQEHTFGYHSDLGELMPACQKFCMEASKLEGSRELIINIMLRTEDFYFNRGTILDIHQALYEGIEWLNKQQNKEV